MRLCDFLIRNKIGLATINLACSFLHLSQLKLNSNVPEDELLLIADAINSDHFKEWFIAKLKIENIEINNAQKLVAGLYIDNVKYNDLEIERITNALVFLIGRKTMPRVVEGKIKMILGNENSNPLERIIAVRKVFLEYKKELEQERERIRKEKEEKYRLIEKKRSDRENYVDLSFDPDSEEAVMRALSNGYGDVYGFD